MKILTVINTFGPKILFYLFLIDYIIAIWNWVNKTHLTLYDKLLFVFILLIYVMYPSSYKDTMKIRDPKEYKEFTNTTDILFGFFIWIVTLFIGIAEFNTLIISFIAILFIIYFNLFFIFQGIYSKSNAKLILTILAVMNTSFILFVSLLPIFIGTLTNLMFGDPYDYIILFIAFILLTILFIYCEKKDISSLMKNDLNNLKNE